MSGTEMKRCACPRDSELDRYCGGPILKFYVPKEKIRDAEDGILTSTARSQTGT